MFSAQYSSQMAEQEVENFRRQDYKDQMKQDQKYSHMSFGEAQGIKGGYLVPGSNTNSNVDAMSYWNFRNDFNGQERWEADENKAEEEAKNNQNLLYSSGLSEVSDGGNEVAI